jgi:hypothetical protein
MDQQDQQADTQTQNPAAKPQEPAPTNPTKPPDKDDPDAVFADKVKKVLYECFPNLDAMHQQYQAGPGFPAANNTGVPAMPTNGTTNQSKPATAPAEKPDKPDDDKDRMQRAQSDIEKSRYQRENEQLQARLATLERESRVARYERDLGHLVSMGYQLDMSEELKDAENLDAAGFERHKERIKKRYQRAPVGGSFIDVTSTNGAPTADLTKEQYQRAVSLVSRKGITLEDAYKQVRESA